MSLVFNWSNSLNQKRIIMFRDFKTYFFHYTPEQLKLLTSSFTLKQLWDRKLKTTLKSPKPLEKAKNVLVTARKIWYTNLPELLLFSFVVFHSFPYKIAFIIFWLFRYLALPKTLFQSLKAKGAGLITIISLSGVLYIDALITDDEPLTEPVEWSLIQSWIMIIFGLSWIAENLISSRYGSYTGRDKRVWFSWYKTYWFVKGWYTLSFGAAAIFVITPFYNELSYNLTMVVGWWNWYTRNFTFIFISLFALILSLSYYTQIVLRYIDWKRVLLYVTIINLVLGYLLYGQFIISFLGYLTDPNWYHSSRLVDYVQLSHEPNKWAWGNSKRDHFSYHRSTTVFWFKTDGPMASALMIFNVFFFISLFSLYIYWVVLFRRIYTTKEVTFTYFTYAVSSLRQFFYYFLLFFVLIYFSYTVSYLRFPIELLWVLTPNSSLENCILVLTHTLSCFNILF